MKCAASIYPESGGIARHIILRTAADFGAYHSRKAAALWADIAGYNTPKTVTGEAARGGRGVPAALKSDPAIRMNSLTMQRTVR